MVWGWLRPLAMAIIIPSMMKSSINCSHFIKERTPTWWRGTLWSIQADLYLDTPGPQFSGLNCTRFTEVAYTSKYCSPPGFQLVSRPLGINWAMLRICRSKEIDRVWRVREGGQVRSDIISVNLKHGSELWVSRGQKWLELCFQFT